MRERATTKREREATCVKETRSEREKQPSPERSNESDTHSERTSELEKTSSE